MNLMESLMAQRLAGRSSGGGSDLTPEVKEALLDCFANVAWATEDGQQYYDALADALYGLQSISAVYTQSGTVYDTDSLDSLKADLVVTALYGDGSTQTVPAESYTLSGTLTEGTSTITVSYGGKTTTFDVTVTTTTLFEWDYTEGINSKIVSVMTVAPVMESDGLLVAASSTAYSQCAIAPNIPTLTESYIVEVTYSNMSTAGRYGNINFCHYNETDKRVRFARRYSGSQNVGYFTDADGSNSVISDFVPTNSGKMTYEYDAVSRTIKYTQGQNTFQRTLSASSAWDTPARLIYAQTGDNAPASSVKIQHIKIQKVV